jgi:predicted nucleotidyltransferase
VIGRGHAEIRGFGGVNRHDGGMYGDRPDPVTAATTFVADHFAGARAAFVGGSVLTDDITPTSDLDVVVVLEASPAPYRETFEHAGWIVEVFAHTRDSLDVWWAKEIAARKTSLLRMCAESVVVVDPAGIAEEIQRVAADKLAAGPPAMTDEELRALRYALTDKLDDMAGCDREDELVYLAGDVVQQTAALALVAAGRWGATGKALARALRAAEPDLAERLVNGHRHVVSYGDTAVLHRAAVDVLLRVGGPLMVGHRVSGR